MGNACPRANAENNMSAFPNSARLMKGGMVLNADASKVQRIVALQYNPDRLTRSLQMPVLEMGTQ
jgi:hypothetical protein